MQGESWTFGQEVVQWFTTPQVVEQTLQQGAKDVVVKKTPWSLIGIAAVGALGGLITLITWYFTHNLKRRETKLAEWQFELKTLEDRYIDAQNRLTPSKDIDDIPSRVAGLYMMLDLARTQVPGYDWWKGDTYYERYPFLERAMLRFNALLRFEPNVELRAELLLINGVFSRFLGKEPGRRALLDWIELLAHSNRVFATSLKRYWATHLEKTLTGEDSKSDWTSCPEKLEEFWTCIRAGLPNSVQERGHLNENFIKEWNEIRIKIDLSTKLLGSSLNAFRKSGWRAERYVKLDHCLLIGLSIKDCKLPGLSLEKSHCPFSLLEKVDAQAAQLAGALFPNSKIFFSNLAGADLSNSRLDYSELESTKFDGATFGSSSAVSCEFGSGSIRNVSFHGSDLHGSNFTGDAWKWLDRGGADPSYRECCKLFDPPAFRYGMAASVSRLFRSPIPWPPRARPVRPPAEATENDGVASPAMSPDTSEDRSEAKSERIDNIDG